MYKIKNNQELLTNLALSPQRIVTLSDGIFSIVMTLLILNVKFPDMKRLSEEELYIYLTSLMPELIIYIYSFLVLGIFWITHHKIYHYIKETDIALLWLSIFYLMFLAILPFSTDIAGVHGDHNLAVIIFLSNLFLVQVLITIVWKYASDKHRLVDDSLNIKYIKITREKNNLVALIFFIALIISFFNVTIPYYITYSIPLVTRYYKRNELKELKIFIHEEE
ncbi:MAG: TMEM175 family protein [Vulcanimicrobiota bacterium]